MEITKGKLTEAMKKKLNEAVTASVKASIRALTSSPEQGICDAVAKIMLEADLQAIKELKKSKNNKKTSPSL